MGVFGEDGIGRCIVVSEEFIGFFVEDIQRVDFTVLGKGFHKFDDVQLHEPFGFVIV